MQYSRSEQYDKNMLREKIMGPNPLKLAEELLGGHRIPKGALVMDLGSGQGITSVFLAREYGFRVVATDLWSDPTENKRFFDTFGLSPLEIMPIHADAVNLPFAHETFDAVVSIDSYNYFGRDEAYLEEKLVPFVKRGGYIYIAIPGMRNATHDRLPPELLLSWTEDQLAYMQDVAYWRRMVDMAPGVRVHTVHEMATNDEAWRDWLACENEYAVGDRKSMEAGAGKYLNFIAIVLERL